MNAQEMIKVDKEKVGEYVSRFHGAVFRLAFSYVKNREDAEDISQEAFLRLYRSDKPFPSDNDVKAWLMRVTINLSKDLLRSAWFKGRAELDENIPCENNEEIALLEWIKKLRPEYSAVIHLFYYEGYSVKEIAKICRISETAVTTRLSRARKQLKEMLSNNERND